MSSSAPSRNSQCPCGSGKRYKHCCGALSETPYARLLGRAEALEKNGDFGGAYNLYSDYLQNEAPTIEIRDRLANVLRFLNKSSQAKQQLELARQENPDSSELFMMLGKNAYAFNDHDGALENYQLALKHTSHEPAIYVLMGNLFLKNKADKAFDYYNKALVLDPDCKEALVRLGNVHVAKGEFDVAKELYVRVLEADDSYAEAILGFAEWLELQGFYEGALDCLGRVDGTALVLADAHCRRASIYKKQFRFPEAIKEAEKSVQLNPREILSYFHLSESQKALGQMDGARKTLATMVSSIPGDSDAAAVAADASEKSNDIEASTRYAKQALEIAPGNRRALLTMVRIARRQNSLDAALKKVLELQKKSKSYGHFRRNLLFEKGKILDKLGRYDESFEAYSEAARVRGALLHSNFDLKNEKKINQQTKRFYSNKLIDSWARFEPIEQLKIYPLFIVGYPRSGTTLVEQILVSHKSIIAADELPFISELIPIIEKDTDGEYPECLGSLNQENSGHLLAKWRTYYLSRASGLGLPDNKSAYFTDKLPLNLIYLPLIKLLFPGSPIIHVIRHPMDACLSSFFTNFEADNGWCDQIEKVAAHYCEIMERLKHFKSVMGENVVFELRYEDLIENQEFWIRKMIEFVGEPWDDNCLKFHETRRLARTASYEQVTQKIFTSSKYRFKKYENLIQKPLAILRSSIEYYGYDI